MRRRGDTSALPPRLRVFDGRTYRTAGAWQRAFDEFHDDRRRWCAARALPPEELPEAVVRGDCPFDPSLI